jgi:peptide/nickel transport system substrate-binding protein
LIDDIRAGKPQMHFLGAGNDMLDCDMTMVYRFISSAAFAIYYNTPDLDALIKEEQAQIDPDKREEIFAEIQQLILQDAPWAAIYDQEDLYGMRARIDWQPRSDEMIVPYEIRVSE